MPSKKSRAKVQRHDVYVYNDSSVMMLAGRNQLGRGFDTDTKEWKKACKEGRLLAVDLGMDAPIYLRVIVGGELDARESAEWVGRLATRMQIPDGKLVIVGGIVLAIEEQDSDDIVDEGDVRVLDVPAGDYRAELYAYVTAPIADDLRARASKTGTAEPLGTWFRRTRPGADFPAWLRYSCSVDTDLDPGHENEWLGLRAQEAETIEFVLRLTPVSGKPPAAAAIDEFGFVAVDAFEARQPDLCPLGLEPVELLGKSSDDEADDEPEVASVHTKNFEIYKRVERFALAPIAGGPVVLPITALARTARLAWFARDTSHPELRVELPPGTAAPSWPRVPYARVDHAAGILTVNLEIPGGGNPFAWELGDRGTLDGIGKLLEQLPAGTIVELVTAFPFEVPADNTPGVLRLRGAIGPDGWSLVESYPAAPAARWKTMLDLSAEVDKGKTLALEPDEVAPISAWAETFSVLFEANSAALTVKGKKVTLENPSASMLGIVAQRLFRMRFADSWPIDPIDDDF
jgi:hypothetical protein